MVAHESCELAQTHLPTAVAIDNSPNATNVIVTQFGDWDSKVWERVPDEDREFVKFHLARLVLVDLCKHLVPIPTALVIVIRCIIEHFSHPCERVVVKSRPHQELKVIDSFAELATLHLATATAVDGAPESFEFASRYVLVGNPQHPPDRGLKLGEGKIPAPIRVQGIEKLTPQPRRGDIESGEVSALALPCQPGTQRHAQLRAHGTQLVSIQHRRSGQLPSQITRRSSVLTGRLQGLLAVALAKEDHEPMQGHMHGDVDIDGLPEPAQVAIREILGRDLQPGQC
mmetsp:Transcript_85485/g.189915  ORF Transcript_85485/g.189915 Transcript_85485/m.189915 type:complete len:285 (-) Transcript_85485:1035-1889(-)